jgi:hypothetical protein
MQKLNNHRSAQGIFKTISDTELFLNYSPNEETKKNNNDTD